MEVIVAPNPLPIDVTQQLVFLGGGIQQCPDWQGELITYFKKRRKRRLIDSIFLNPRRPNFPIQDPRAAEEQITWEFKMLEKCDIFTMLFCNSISPQPICFYELGRNIERMKEKFPSSWEERIIISCDENFIRRQDVEIQTRLATDGKVRVGIYPTFELIPKHCNEIINLLNLDNYL